MNERTVILVLDRGHVKIAKIARHEELAFHWRCSAARIIRRWGTQRGLAQLRTGKLPATELDELHSGDVPWRAVLDIIDVEADAWEPHLTWPSSELPKRKRTASLSGATG